MAAGFAARMAVAITCDCHAYADEFMNYLEQAHRWVFGYGFIPWGYRFGVRTWLIPAIPAIPLWISKATGFDSPSFYVPFAYSFNALISMAIPAGMYFFTRRTVSENAARYALVFGVFWYELVVFAPRTLAEVYATAAFFGAFALLSRNEDKKIIAAGFLLGLAVAFRPVFAPTVAVFGLMWFISLPRKRGRLMAVCGGTVALVVWGFVDFLTWGQFFHSWFAMVSISPAFSHLDFFDAHLDHWYSDIVKLAVASLGLHAISLIAGTIRLSGFFLPILAVFITLASHIFPIAAEYRNVFIVIPLLLIAAAGITDLAGNQIKLIICALFLSVSAAGFSGKLPKMESAFGNYTRYISSSTTPGIVAAKQLSQLPDLKVRGILWLAGNQTFSGGYFYLHKNIPSYFIADPQNRKTIQNALNSGTKLNAIASHIVTPTISVRGFQGFKKLGEIPGWKEWAIYENLTPEAVTPLAGYYYNTFDPNWDNIGNLTAELGIKTNPLPLTSYRKPD